MKKEKERFGTMKNKNDFIDFYDKEYKVVINKVFSQELKKYNNVRIIYILESLYPLLLIILVGIIVFFLDEFNMPFKIFAILCFLNVFVVNIIINDKRIKNQRIKFFSKINSLIYYDLLYFITGNSESLYYPNTALNIDEFDQMNLFNLDLLAYDSKNFTNVLYLNKPFILCDVTLSTIKDKYRQEKYYDESSNTEYIYDIYEQVEREIFNGLYYETIIDRNNNDFIYLIPNNFNDKYIDKNIYRYIKYHGKKVNLENFDFSEKYEVFSLNEHQSRYMLTPLIMEKINELDKIIPNKKYIVFKEDGRVGIFIDGFSIENLLKKRINYHNNTIDKEYLISYFNDVNSLVKISQILKYKKD